MTDERVEIVDDDGVDVNVEDKGGAGRDAGPDAAALQAELGKQTELVNRLTALVADPDVAALLKAKEDGQGYRLVTGKEKPKEPDGPAPLPPALDLDAMRPSEVVNLLLERLPAVVGKVIDDKTKPLVERVDAAEAERSAGRKAELARTVETLREKYPDFLEYREQIKRLAGSGQLTLEEAYVVSRMKAGKGMPSAPTPTERPTGITVRTHTNDDKPARTGPRGFSQDLADVLDNTELTGSW